ncbi:hypothetical protein C8R45DRAFT_1086775 [Mycena sanguinolenta]|nr:hypothetical protein C8R45DRAFT_1086775 [Mycena sanguinolenta]
MRFLVFTTLSISLGLLAQHAIATIFIGNHLGYTVAWTNADENPCIGTVDIAPTGDNFCSIPFTLSNGYTYTAQGCGDGLWIDNGDGSFNSNCYSVSSSGFCGRLGVEPYTVAYSCY